MAEPTRYELAYDFTAFQSSFPTTPLPADKLEIEFNALQTTTDGIINNLNLIQRADGALANNSVGADQLATTLAIGLNPASAWTTSTAYLIFDVVFINNIVYKCEESHTSGVFATDLADGKWSEILDFNDFSSVPSSLVYSISGTNTITGTSAISAYSPGLVVHFVPAGANTSAVTLNINSLGAVAVEQAGEALVGGELRNATMLIYDGTAFQIVNPSNRNIMTLSSVSGTDIIAGISTVPISAYSAGQIFFFVAAGTNTGAVTLNVSSIGAVAVENNGSALVAGEITSGGGYGAIYDGTAFQLLNSSGSTFFQTLKDDVDAATARGTLGAAASGANSDITSLAAVASINTGQLAGFRNGVINGDFSQWNRGTSFTPSAGANTYTADRWEGRRDTNANYTISRQAGPDGSRYCARIQRDSATSDTNAIAFAQPFSTANSHRYRGKKATIRFKARSGANYSAASGNLAVRVQTGTGTDENILSGYTGNANDISQNVVLTTSWQTFTITSAAVLSASLTEVGVRFETTPVGTAGAADYFEIAEVELVEGEVGSTYFERLSAEVVRAQCLPYFEILSYPDAGDIVGSGYADTTAIARIHVPFYPKRIAPTITSTAASTFRGLYQGNATSAGTSIAFTNIDVNGARLDLTVTATPLTAGNGVMVQSVGSATISLSSEL